MHTMGKHRLADIEQAERDRTEKLPEVRKQRDEYRANLAACERYDIAACKQISPTLLFVPGTGISDGLDEISKNTSRFNAAFENAQKFRNYLDKCADGNRIACESALAMRNITSADRARLEQMQAALPWFNLDDPKHFIFAIITVPILGFLAFIFLAGRSPATRSQEGRIVPSMLPAAPARSPPRPGFRSRLARMIDPSLQPAMLQAVAPTNQHTPDALTLADARPQTADAPRYAATASNTLKEEVKTCDAAAIKQQMNEFSLRDTDLPLPTHEGQSDKKTAPVPEPPFEAPRDPETARIALAVAHSYLSELPDTLASDVAGNAELARQYRSTLALAAKQLDIAQDADPTQKLFIANEDEPPQSISQQWLRARTIHLEALTWMENPKHQIQLLTQATEVGPTMAPAFASLGYVHSLSRNRVSAIAAFEQALILDPGNIEYVKFLDRARNMTDAEIATYKLSNECRR